MNIALRRQTLHEQIAERLRREIATKFRPGQKLDSEAKLAQRFQVSVRTVREAITTFVHDGLVERRAGHGTTVCERNLSQHVALVLGVPRDHARLGYFNLRLLEHLHQFFSEHGLTPRLYWACEASATGEADGVWREFTRAVARGEVAGVVVLKGPLEARWWAAIGDSRLPTVGGDRKDTRYGARPDYTEFLSEAVRHLALAGRRRIGLLAWSPGPPTRPEIDGLDLRPLFPETVRQQGCETRAGWLRADLWPVDAGAGYDMFREVWMALAEKPDGLVISDEALFTDAATAILEIGIRVPEDLLIVTHANRGSGTLYPFPTVRLEYDPDELGRRLGNQLLRLLRREAVPEGVTKLPFRWVGADAVEQRLLNRLDASPKTGSRSS